jgi:NADH:ubiquinone oxidoreductase subunit 2 (subunit N)
VLHVIALNIFLILFMFKVVAFPGYFWVSGVYSGTSYKVLLVYTTLSKAGLLTAFILNC